MTVYANLDLPFTKTYKQLVDIIAILLQKKQIPFSIFQSGIYALKQDPTYLSASGFFVHIGGDISHNIGIETLFYNTGKTEISLLVPLSEKAGSFAFQKSHKCHSSQNSKEIRNDDKKGFMTENSAWSLRVCFRTYSTTYFEVDAMPCTYNTIQYLTMQIYQSFSRYRKTEKSR
jgi:hypothetical protein